MASSICDYTVLRKIGTGSFGTCYKVLKRETGEIFVWKAISYGKMTEDKKKLLVNEVNLLSGLAHPNIVKYNDRIIHKPTTTIYIVMEWCAGGDLSTLINQCKKINIKLEEKFVWRVLYQLAEALHVCHTKVPEGPVLHRDIKPANVFLDGCGNVKLGDFGLAYLLEDGKSSVLSGIVGTPFYLSPEAIQNGHYNEKSDIWSLGCLIYELCSLHPPFDGSNLRTLIQSIQVGRYDRIPPAYSENLQNIIKLMLRVESQSRPTADSILHHSDVIMHLVRGSLEAFKCDSCCDAGSKARSQKQKNISQSCNCGEEIAQIKDVLQMKLERVKEWESFLSLREAEVSNKEKAIVKREKQVALTELVVREKVTQAELYLQFCHSNRSMSSKSIHCNQNFSGDLPENEEEGDTSFTHPTSAKLNPKKVEKPFVFSRLGSERRVHFATLPSKRTQHSEVDDGTRRINSQSVSRVNHLLIDGYSVRENPNANVPLSEHKVDKSEKVKISKSKRSSVIIDRCSSSSSSNHSHPNNQSWKDERKRWLEQKRALFIHSNKENVPIVGDSGGMAGMAYQFPLAISSVVKKSSILK